MGPVLTARDMKSWKGDQTGELGGKEDVFLAADDKKREDRKTNDCGLKGPRG